MMRSRRMTRLAAAVLVLLLGGCLEVEQSPQYADGAYAGKKDDQAPARKFGNDRVAWEGAIAARTGNQNEYLRAKP